jgi:23S rRNA pseudouridine1911/1915/1917 synthase
MIKQEQTVLTVVVEPGDEGMRLDAFLAKRLEEHSRAQVSKLIKAGHVTNRGILVKSSQSVLAGDIYSITLPTVKSSSLIPQNITLNIIYSDEHIAIINKPKGMVVHPGAGVSDGTLCNALLYYFPDMIVGNAERPGIVHRLDKDTSGVMVVAKNHISHQRLSEDFKNRRVKKIYRALCFGDITKSAFSLITGHARHPHNRLKFSTKMSAPTEPSNNIRVAHTDFIVLNRKFNITELSANLQTGRTHQIRAHCADIGYPILGDEIYGGKKVLASSVPISLREAVKNLPGQALHAETIEFAHPITKAMVSFSAPLPDEMGAISQLLERLV